MAIGVVALVFLAASVYARARIETHLNRVVPVALPEASPQALALHRDAFVADLHADSLLFGRDLLHRSEIGHVDVPRLREGGVRLQGFGGVTWVPLSVELQDNVRGPVDILGLAGLLLDPGFALDDTFGRARRLAGRLDGFVSGADGALRWIRSRSDLAALAADSSGAVGALYGLVGAHLFEEEGASVAEAFDFGVRMVGLAHFFDNAFVGSAHGTQRGGLTPRGRELVAEMQARGMVVDLAHVSPAGVRDVLAMMERPVVVSHGGVRGTCDNVRNLSDAELDAIARNGGVVGIGYFDWAICGTELAPLLAAIQYVIDRVGDRHVALGSDYDGTIDAGFDTAALPSLTQALLDAGHAPDRVRRIMGGNVLRVLDEALPAD